MDNLIKYDNECAIHKGYDIKLICSTCKTAVCAECIVSGHTGHKFDHINVESSKPIFEEFKNNHLENLDNQIDINKEILNKSNTLFQSLEDKHNENINQIKEGFKELNKLLQIIEADKIRQLLTLFDENKDTNTNISTIIDDNINKIKSITNKYKNTTNQLNIEQIINNNNQLIEILKHCHQSQLLMKDNQNENNINQLIYQYKNVEIVNNSELKNSIKEIFEINSSSTFSNGYPKRVQIGGTEYFIYRNDSIIPIGARHVAIAPSVKTIEMNSIPKSVQFLMLLDGFDVQLTEGMLPNSINTLLIGNIKKPLIKAIPSSVRNLILFGGFNQEIGEFQSRISIYLIDSCITKFPINSTIYKSQNYKLQTTHPNLRYWDVGSWKIIIE
ncbi:hypothetical protein ACTFIU_004714 [Dictyostelium citrinum]